MSVISATTEDLASVADVIDLNHEFFEHIHDDELKSFRRSLVTPAASVYDGEDDTIHQHMVRKRTDVPPTKIYYQRPVSRGESVLLFKKLNDGDDEGYIDLVSSEMKDFIDTDFMMSEMYSRPVSRVTMISHNEPVKKFIPIIRNYQQTHKSLVSREEKATRLCKVKTLETILENTKQTSVKKPIEDQKPPRSRTQTLNRYTATKTIPQRALPKEQEQASNRYTSKIIPQRALPKEQEQASNRYTSKIIPQRALPKEQEQASNRYTSKIIPQRALPKEQEQASNRYTSKIIPQRALPKEQEQASNRYISRIIPQRALPKEQEQASNQYISRIISQRVLPKEQTLNRCTSKTIPQRTLPTEQRQSLNLYNSKTMPQSTLSKEQTFKRYTIKIIPQRVVPKEQTLDRSKTIPQMTLYKEKEQAFNRYTSKLIPQRTSPKEQEQTFNRYTAKTILQRTSPEERPKKPVMPQLAQPKRYELQKDIATTKSQLPTYKKSNLVQDRTPSYSRQADASRLAARPKFIPHARHDSTSSSSSSEEEQQHPYHIRQVSLPLYPKKNYNCGDAHFTCWK